VKVLIVDDNANSLQILRSQVSAWKMEVAAADSADSALKLMRAAALEHPFEVALIDVKMPDLDGIELTRLIKSDPALAAVAVILVSSVGTANDFRTRLQGIELGGWLSKPVPQSSLYSALVKAPGRGNQPGPDARAPSAAGHCGKPPRRGSLRLSAGRKLRVLLAENNPINQKLAKFQLKKLGVDVDCVSNGREAVEAVMRIPYDAVMMDCQMPEMDGYESTREIRWLEGPRRHAKIIAVTAHALSGDRETCLAAGMDAYISKPVKPEILEEILVQVIAPASATGTAAPGESPARGATASDPGSHSQVTQPAEAAGLLHAANGNVPA
jgi:two-component system sensor histidine kinase/response regulator